MDFFQAVLALVGFGLRDPLVWVGIAAAVIAGVLRWPWLVLIALVVGSVVLRGLVLSPVLDGDQEGIGYILAAWTTLPLIPAYVLGRVFSRRGD